LLKRLFASVLLLCALAAPAFAAKTVRIRVPTTHDRWIRVDTPHFTLFSEAPRKRTLEIAADLERFRLLLSTFHKGFRADPPVPTHVYLFATDRSYTPYKLRTAGKVKENAGYFLARPCANYVTIEVERGRDAGQTVYHEYVHQFLYVNLSRVPVWFGEGMAEYYSTFRATETTAEVGFPIQEHLAWLAMHEMQPLRDLFQVDHDSPEYNENERQGTFYAQSWAFVHYLLQSKSDRKAQMGEFLDQIASGRPLDEAFRASLGAGYEQVEEELRSYVSGRQFSYVRVKFDKPVRVDATVRTTPISKEEALARLGDLLVHLDPERAQEALDHFREALRSEPDNPTALAGIGLVDATWKRYREAEEQFRTTAAANPQNPLYAYYQAAALLGYTPTEFARPPRPELAPEDREKARELLRKAIEIRPEFPEALVALACTATDDEAGSAEAIPLLEKTRTLIPSRVEVAAELFGRYLLARRRDQAAALLDGVLAPSGEKRVVEWARMMLEGYDLAAGGGRTPGGPDGPESGTTRDLTPLEIRKSQESHLAFLEKLLQETTDPEARSRIEDQIRQIREQVDYPSQVETFNAAVGLANGGDLKGAAEILEKLLPEVQDEELARATREMLEKLRAELIRRGQAGK
jgi:tetratricopeptide (TPR) repeat protein